LLALLSVEVYENSVLGLVRYLCRQHVGWIAVIIQLIAALASKGIRFNLNHLLFAIVFWACEVEDLFIVLHIARIAADDVLICQKATTRV
jgi:hypothetical protein